MYEQSHEVRVAKCSATRRFFDTCRLHICKRMRSRFLSGGTHTILCGWPCTEKQISNSGTAFTALNTHTTQ